MTVTASISSVPSATGTRTFFFGAPSAVAAFAAREDICRGDLMGAEKKRDLETADPTARRSRRFRGTRLANAGTQPLRAVQVM